MDPETITVPRWLFFSMLGFAFKTWMDLLVWCVRGAMK